MKQFTRNFPLRALGISLAVCVITLFSAKVGNTQTRRDVFKSGEELVYNVKYGFITLGTVVISTGNMSNGQVNARLKFWTADVPFLNTKSTVTDWINMKDIYLTRFQEQSSDGDKTYNKHFEYDAAAKTLTYSDENVKNEVTQNVGPFDDALTLVYAMRSWSAAAGHRYSFQMRGKDGLKPVVVNFTNKTSMEEVPALDDKEVRTRVLEGQADMGGSSPLGADGAFTAYISDDAQAIPVRIDMKIAVGSISLTLAKFKRPDWVAAK